MVQMKPAKPTCITATHQFSDQAILNTPNLMWHGDVQDFLAKLPMSPLFDLVVTSPPYNLGKIYEQKKSLAVYVEWQEQIIDQIIPRLKPEGSLCWQVGNFVDNGHIVLLDIELAPIFRRHGLAMRNRIIWHFGHGLHTRRSFSGRYEVILWYTKTDDYVFNLDAVRIPAKYRVETARAQERIHRLAA